MRCGSRRPGSRGRERLQRARAAVPEPRERDGEIHTPDEHITVDDLDAMVEVTLALIDAARDVEP